MNFQLNLCVQYLTFYHWNPHIGVKVPKCIRDSFRAYTPKNETWELENEDLQSHVFNWQDSKHNGPSSRISALHSPKEPADRFWHLAVPISISKSRRPQMTDVSVSEPFGLIFSNPCLGSTHVEIRINKVNFWATAIRSWKPQTTQHPTIQPPLHHPIMSLTSNNWKGHSPHSALCLDQSERASHLNSIQRCRWRDSHVCMKKFVPSTLTPG